jgi:hypothetical protein
MKLTEDYVQWRTWVLATGNHRLLPRTVKEIGNERFSVTGDTGIPHEFVLESVLE